MAITIVGNTTIKNHMVRKDGNKEVAQRHFEIKTGNYVCEDEDDWYLRQVVAWMILKWGLDIL